MKQNIKSTLKAILVLLVAFTSSPLYAADGDVFTAKTVEGVDMTFKVIREADKTCQVGEGGYRGSCISSSIRGRISIPSSANGYLVTTLSQGAFYDCSGLTNITIPNSVTTINTYAFLDCSGLTSITIPSSVTSIGYAFLNCSGLECIIVQEGNTVYDSRDNCNAIIRTTSNKLISGCKNTIIPNSVKSIDTYAFYGCSGLTHITIPNSVTSIGDNAFYGCSGLTNITIPNSVTNIGSHAFHGCSGPKSITIPNSVTIIGDCAFMDCLALTSVTIPNSVTSIGVNPFAGCSSITSIVVEQGNINYNSREDCNAIIGTLSHELVAGCKNTIISNSVTSIGAGAFYGCLALTSITIPNSVTTIDYCAFQNCSELTSIIIPNSVTMIGSDAFYGSAWYENQSEGLVYAGKVAYKYKGEMPSNTSVMIKDGTLGIAEEAFYDCSGLTNITIPNSVKCIGWSAFEECSGLTNITIPNSVTHINSEAFSQCTSLISIISEKKEPAIIADDVFSASNKHTLYVPYGTSEKYKAITGWNRVSKIEESLMNDDVFTDFSQEGVEITFKVISVKDKECQVGIDNAESAIVNKNAKIITLPEMVKGFNVTKIVDGAFANSSSLQCISIPASVMSVGNQIFKDCSNLATIKWDAEVSLISMGIEDINNPNLLLYVKNKDYAPKNVKNVIVNGVAENIILKEASHGNNFYCPEEFMAKNIEFTHNYSMTSGYQTCQGWETITLPFDVTSIIHESSAEMVPISTWDDSGVRRPFWLYEQTTEGWKAAAAIKANKPYIICMPNNLEQYDPGYCIMGNVAFMGTNVKVQASDNLKAETYNGRTFVPNYQNQSASSSIYALNVNNEWDKYEYTTYLYGSTFFPNLRAVHPFECYMTTSDGSAREFIPIFEDSMPAGISDALRLMNNEKLTNKNVYNLNGQRVEHPKKGVYIINGRKVVIK